MRPLISIIILALLLPLNSLGYYKLTDNCKEAFREIFSLRTETARKMLAEEKKLTPDNSFIIYLEHYCDVIEIIVLDDGSKYEQFRDDFYERRDIMDEDDESSPYHQMLEAEMYFHLGLSYLKFGNRMNGARKVYSSYKMVKNNEEDFPDFVMDDKLAGMFDMMFANIPPVVRWAAKIIGLEGDLEGGFERIKSYHDSVINIPGFAEESIIIMNLAYKLTWNEQEGYEFLGNLDERFYNSVLIKYFYANLAAFSAHNDFALELLSEIDRDRMEVEFYAMDYLTGRCKLCRLDKNADEYLLKYLNNFPGDDYKKDVCNRLSWHYFIHGNRSEYLYYKEKVSRVGDDLRDRDREAILEAERSYDPKPELLKARLLFDGGYYEEAEDEMKKLAMSDLELEPYVLEYHYRLGRIFQKTERTEKAIQELSRTIQIGRDKDYTFATRAALALGEIYTQQDKKDRAIEYYELCLDIYDSDHTAEGVENKAEKKLEAVSAISN